VSKLQQRKRAKGLGRKRRQKRRFTGAKTKFEKDLRRRKRKEKQPVVEHDTVPAAMRQRPLLELLLQREIHNAMKRKREEEL